ncbi:MAG: hypothetical protein IIC91_14815 [Chloroflexi bacterium]|nr:hypothetical protein [Chloroflexota bacterium]
MHVKFGAATLSILAVVLALGIVVGSTSGTAAASDSRLRLEGDLNLDTRDGDSVPGMSASDIIEVRQGTTVVVSGSLMPK